MLLKDLKETMLIPGKEIIINKMARIREKDIHLISITLEEHRKVLWAMCHMPRSSDDVKVLTERTGPVTNREKMLNNLGSERNSFRMHLSEVTLQEHKMTVSSSGARGMNHMNYEGYMQLQHFIENGTIPAIWDEVDLDNIVIVSYELEMSGEIPEIDSSKELEITLKLGKEFRQMPINQSMRLEFGEMKKGAGFCFYDPIGKRERTFYLDGLEHFDIWEDAKNKYTDEWTKALPKEQVDRMKEQYLAQLEKTCPNGMDLAVLEYEMEDGAQLNFYSADYLNETPSPDSSSAFVLLLSSDKQPGMNGLRSRKCIIAPVDKNFNGSMDVELFSWYMEVPEEIIRV